MTDRDPHQASPPIVTGPGLGGACTVEELRRQIERLPRFSRLVLRFLETARLENAPASAFEKILAADDELAAWVLRLANSGFFHLARPILTLGEGLVVIGLVPLTRMVFIACTRDLLRFRPRAYEYPGQGFWRHAVAVALTARELAAVADTAGRLLPDEAFVAGLAHDLGKRLLDPHLPARGGMRPISPAEERALLGMDHPAVGEHLVHRWGLPETVSGPVGRHHAPGSDPAACVVALADALANHWGLGPRIYGDPERELPEGTWLPLRRPLDLTAEAVVQVATRLSPVLRELDEMLRLVGSGSRPPVRRDEGNEPMSSSAPAARNPRKSRRRGRSTANSRRRRTTRSR